MSIIQINSKLFVKYGMIWSTSLAKAKMHSKELNSESKKTEYLGNNDKSRLAK